MTDFLIRFKEMVEDLKKNKNITVLEFKCNSPITETELEEIKSKYNLPSDIIDFYSQADGITLKWKLKDSEESYHGYIEILPLSRVLGSWSDAVHFDNYPPENLPFHAFEFYDAECVSLIHIDEDCKVKPTVFLMGSNLEVENLTLTFAKYLEYLLISRGYCFWQYAILGGHTSYLGGIDHEAFVKTMSMLFSDFDYKEFYPDEEIYKAITK